MDEGRAALYAAIIGFAAAIIGAAVGGWASWRAARHSAEASARAAAQQVVGQGRNEHLQWIREGRRAAYVNLIKAFRVYGQSTAACAVLLVAGLRPEVVRAVDQTREDLLRLDEAADEVWLWGPDSVHEATRDLWDHAAEFRRQLSAWERAVTTRPSDRPACEEAAKECNRHMVQSYAAFISAASEALRRDSPPHTPVRPAE